MIFGQTIACYPSVFRKEHVKNLEEHMPSVFNHGNGPSRICYHLLILTAANLHILPESNSKTQRTSHTLGQTPRASGVRPLSMLNVGWALPIPLTLRAHDGAMVEPGRLL